MFKTPYQKKIIAAWTLALASSFAGAASLKIGTVDVSRVVDNSDWGRGIKTTLEKEAISKKEVIEKEQLELQKMGQKLQDPSSVSNKKVREKEMMEFSTRAKNLRELVEKSEMEIANKRTTLYQPVVEELKSLTESLAKKKGLDLVLEVQAGVGSGTAPLLYAADKVDLTDELLKALNEKKKK